MSGLIDLTGQKFFRLTVIERANTKGSALWKCRCDCGKEVIIQGGNLRRPYGNQKSCGCWRKENVKHLCTTGSANPSFKHGHALKGKLSSTFTSWCAMIQRCTDSDAERYPAYGGRGVTVCARWQGKDGFQNFLADLGERPPGTTLGRFGDVGNYEPSNVKWMTSAEQVANWRPDRKHRGKKNSPLQATDTVNFFPLPAPNFPELQAVN